MQIETVDYKASDAPQRLACSLRETGFAVLANHPISPERIDEAYDLWGGFFASETKSDYLRDYEKQDGYFPFKSEHAKDAAKKDLKEFYHVYPWGRVPEDLNAFTRQLYADLTAIGVELLSWLDQQMPEELRNRLSAPLQEMMSDSQQSLLRILHYPPVGQDEDAAAIRAAAHEDINLITLLLAGSQPGLQARDKQGNWHDVPCDPGMITFIPTCAQISASFTFNSTFPVRYQPRLPDANSRGSPERVFPSRQMLSTLFDSKNWCAVIATFA